MLHILSISLPFFALVLCGFLAARRRVLPLEAVTGLNSFVLYFALPCMLYSFGADTPILQLLDPAVALVWALCALVLVAFAVSVSLNARIGWTDAAFGALVATFPNTGFMGVPLLVALAGPGAAGPVILTMLIDMVLTTSLCIALSRLQDAGAQGARAAAWQALRGIVVNPLPWSIALGALSSALGWRLQGPVRQTLVMLADAASPVALFTIGAVLARSQLRAQAQKHPPIPWADVLPMALAKLLLHPLLVLLLGSALRQIGLPLPTPVLVVLVLAAALPSASNVSLLAERYGADNGRIARIILVSTAAALASLVPIVHWLVPRY
jgi:predicted permease